MSLLALLVSATTNAQTLIDRAKTDDLAYMADEEPAMRRAFEKARAELDEFLRKAKAPPPDTFGYSVKVAIREGRSTEYFWIGHFTETNGRFTGKIDNEPRVVTSVTNGQPYSFGKEQIVDWLYVNRTSRKMYGNFTMCALLTKESPKEADAMRIRYGLDCGA
jgi:uncharacterized protein YegJ (DUF2314 family)